MRIQMHMTGHNIRVTFNCPEMMLLPGDQESATSIGSLKAELRGLQARKQDLELELESWTARLRDTGADLHTPLVDSEASLLSGFMRVFVPNLR